METITEQKCLTNNSNAELDLRLLEQSIELADDALLGHFVCPSAEKPINAKDVYDEGNETKIDNSKNVVDHYDHDDCPSTSRKFSAENGSVVDSNSTAPRLKNDKCVRFPDDEKLITHKYEPARPLFYFRRLEAEKNDSPNSLNVHEILQAYINACRRCKIPANPKVEKQISGFHLNEHERQEIFCLRGDKVTPEQMDCLEEIFKRVQFVNLDFEYCFLDDDAIVALCDMLEFYESCLRLNLSFNQHITFRGWQAICRMLKKSGCLEQINLRYTSLNERSLPLLCRCLKTTETSLTSLHLENCNLSGRSMLLLACAMKLNTSIRDLHLAENNLSPTDGAHLYQIILNNVSLELLDMRNNQLQDAGFAHICDALQRHDNSQSKSKLNTLVLWNNKLTSQAMIHLIRVLLENKTLKTLNLGCNNICSEGMSIIKEALARNRTLLRLGLQSTKLNCQGAIAIAESIADNSSLIRVDLRANPDIKSAGLLALHVALRMNKTITSLNLDKSLANAVPPASKNKDHSNPAVEQLKSMFDEISAYCRRNYDSYVQKLMSSVKQKTHSTPPASNHDLSQTDYSMSQDILSSPRNAESTIDDESTKIRGAETNMSDNDNYLVVDVKIAGRLENSNSVEYTAEEDDDDEEKIVILEEMIDEETQTSFEKEPDKENDNQERDEQTENVSVPSIKQEPEYFYNYRNPSKKCVRKISLTCKELIDNLKERFETMPRFEDDDVQTKNNTLDENEETKETNLLKLPHLHSVEESENLQEGCDFSPPPRPQSTPPIPIPMKNDAKIGDDNRLFQKSISLSLPLIGQSSPIQSTLASSSKPIGAGGGRIRRFSVSKVDSTTATNLVTKKLETIISSAESAPCSPVAKISLEMPNIVTPGVMPRGLEIPEFSGVKMHPIEEMLDPKNDEISQSIDQLIKDLIRYVEYECGDRSSIISRSSSSSKIIEPTVDKIIQRADKIIQRVDKSEDDENISMAVQFITKSLIKKVCLKVDKKLDEQNLSEKVNFIKLAAARSSIMLKKKKNKAI
uniref:Protein phosphatase 1 regulatory subunit 37 n=1 Tax=Romanomermis culicivorax TaxID=13658 RepID=A0A915KYQ5_ROMCU